MCLATTNLTTAQNSRTVRVGEDGLRKSAYKIIMPDFPEQSKKRNAHGVAVVQLEYDGNGDVTRVKALQTPDSDIERAVVAAVQRWKFRPSTIGGVPLKVRGKLTFYYVIDRRGARVNNPKLFQ